MKVMIQAVFQVKWKGTYLAESLLDFKGNSPFSGGQQIVMHSYLLLCELARK